MIVDIICAIAFFDQENTFAFIFFLFSDFFVYLCYAIKYFLNNHVLYFVVHSREQIYQTQQDFKKKIFISVFHFKIKFSTSFNYKNTISNTTGFKKKITVYFILKS